MAVYNKKTPKTQKKVVARWNFNISHIMSHLFFKCFSIFNVIYLSV